MLFQGMKRLLIQKDIRNWVAAQKALAALYRVSTLPAFIRVATRENSWLSSKKLALSSAKMAREG